MKKIKLKAAVLLLFIVVMGMFYTRYNWIKIETEAYNNIMQIARSIEISIRLDDLQTLEATPDDINKPQYRILKSMLIDIIRVNPKARFAYIYTLKNDKIFFYADSEPEHSKDYSPPGQEYTEAKSEDKQPFFDGKELITRPLTDRWGTWISVLIPVKDEVTGKTMAVFGMDFDANFWKKVMFYETIESSLLILLLLLTFYFLFLSISRNRSLKREITERLEAQEVLSQGRERAHRQRDAIARIVGDEVISIGNLSDSLQRLTKEVAEAVQVERTSVWLSSHDKSQMKCILLFDNTEKTHSSGTVLSSTDYPRYFTAIKRESRINAEDAQNDPRTSDFNQNYSTPLGITSLLDAGIFLESELVGVVCLEHTGEKRKWYSDEESFASTIASIVAQTLANCKRKLAEDEIHKLNETLEERVAQRTSQLEAINKELAFHLREIEQFTYIASHDLQEPLLTLNSFTQMLQDEFSGKLSEDGNKYVEIISDSAGRMRNLVKGLLDYSLLGKDSLRMEVDCHKLVCKVLTEMDALIQECNARITLQDLPVIVGFPKELQLLFRSLIHNAIKFGQKDVIPEISISARRDADAWEFVITDNGIGIHEKDKEKIFIIFKRLHNRDEYGGTGIGLAHCKKIVEMHGGKIWVESMQNTGSTFKFTIPFES